MPRTLGRWAALLVFGAFAACRTPAPATTVILVRHAERPAGQDPDLNPLGRARAESLSVALLRTKVDAIIHTQFKRTQQTAAPLATRSGITPMVVGATGTEQQHAQAVVDRIAALAGKTIVYVGHSNTVPVVIAQLGITPAQPIPDSDYQHFFIVRKRGTEVELIRVKY
jgi:broad specificity phosphatase PhoE